jgi:MFS family permease
MSLIVNTLRSYGRFQRNARLYLLSYALSGVTTGIILVLYNLYLAALGYSTDFIGLVLFAATLGAGLSIFPAGLCVDRFGGKAILIWASLEIGIAGAGQIFFRQPTPLLVSAFLVGVGGAFVIVVNAPFLTLNSSPAERAQLFSLAIVVSLITTVLGEVLGGALPLWFRTFSWLMAPLPVWGTLLLVSQPLARSYQLALLFAGIIAAPSFIPLFLMHNDCPLRTNRVQSPSSALRPRLELLWVTIRATDLATLVRNPLLVITAIYTLFGAGAGLFLPYANLYFVQHLGASSALFGLIDGAANTLNALATLAAPWVALRIGKMKALTVTRLFSLPIQLLIGLTSFLPLAAFLYPLRQALMDMSVGLLQVYSMESVPSQRRGFANSSYQAAFQAVQALTTPLGGWIIARSGFGPVFVGAAVLYLLAIVLLWLSFKLAFRLSQEVSGDETEAQHVHIQ